MIKSYFLTTIHTLRQNPLYTALSVFGIALTFVFVCILILIVKNSKGNYLIPDYAGRTWEVYQLSDQKNGFHTVRNGDLCETLVSQMKTPEIVTVTSHEMNLQMILGDLITWPNVMCIGTNYDKVCRFDFIRGRPINEQEIAEAVPVAVIDQYFANLCFGRGDDPIGQTLDMEGIFFQIVGVVEDISVLAPRITSANVWIPITVLKRRDFKRCISFTAKDEASVDAMKAEFTRVLATINTKEGIEYRIAPWRQKTVEQEGGFGTFFSLIGCLILILIPALNILSLNVSKSYDRSEEIAIRKAFGAPLSTIFGQLFIENLIITLIGAVIGILAAMPVMNAIERMLHNGGQFAGSLSLHFDLVTILLVVGPCVLLFSFFSGSIPAWITAKREIVNVIKGEAQ